MTASSLTRITFALACATFACGASNSERPYADGAGPPISPAVPPRADAGPSSPPPSIDGVDATPTDAGGAPKDGAPSDAAPAGPDMPSNALPACPSAALPAALPACEPASAPASTTRPWKNFGSAILATGAQGHRGRDLFLIADPAAPQWLIGKFSYGPFDLDLTGEEVDIHLLRGCGASWEMLGTATTTSDGQHPETEGADDSGGRVYYQLPPAQRLAPGRHRVRFVVAGDGSFTDAFIEVVPPGTRLAVMDVDGTLTTSETAEFGSLLTGQTPAAEPDAARVAAALASKGYRPYYLTARPEWLTGRTREFLTVAGFPPGILETTTGGSGAVGAAAGVFKTAALARITGKGLVPGFALGNSDTDATAYASANIAPAGNRVFLRFTDASNGGRRVEKYADLLPSIEQLPRACR